MQLCTIPVFDKKYRAVVKVTNPSNYLSMMDWIHLHSKNSVDIKTVANGTEFGENDYYFAFEDRDDALIFKIKYSL